MSFGQGYNNFPDYGATSANLSNTRSDSNDSLYYQYCDNISCNIFCMNNNIAALEKACQDIGTADDSPLLRDKIHRVKQDTNYVANTTMRFVKELKRLAISGGREERIQSERLENIFRATVSRYDLMQKQLVPKMEQAMLPVRKNFANLWGIEDNDEEKQSLIDAERLQQEKKVQDELTFEEGMLLEREERIRQIESDILDVNGIFKELAMIVQVQGETMGTIEDNVTNIALAVEKGTSELTKAGKYKKAQRKNLCWFVFILLIVAAIIVTIISLSR